MDHGIWYNLAMILYHGSNLVVSIPELIEQNHTLDFIVDNRCGVYSGPQYDVKIGPVANDNVYTTIQLYMSGVLSRDTAIRELKVRKLFNQVVFSSQRALAMLNFAGSEVIG